MNYHLLGFFIKPMHPREISNTILSEEPNNQKTLATIVFDIYKKFIKKVMKLGYRIKTVYIV